MPEHYDSSERIERLLDTAEPELRHAFLRMVAEIKSALTLAAIADHLERGEMEEALAAALRPAAMLGEAYTDAFIAAAKDTAKEIGVALGEVRIVYDQTNVGAVNAINNNKLRLIRGFTEDQRATTRQALSRAIAEGQNPLEAARTFRDSIGLTPRQELAVRNYRRALESGDRAALERELRDKRFDASVRAALEGRKPLSQAQIDKMVDRYRDKMLKHRSEVIARTEALRSVHQGSEEMYRQAIASGDLRADNLSREWNTARDERVRDSHAEMHGQVQPFGQPFVSGAGNLLMYPGDPEAPPEETIQCRCAVGTRIVTLVGMA